MHIPFVSPVTFLVTYHNQAHMKLVMSVFVPGPKTSLNLHLAIAV